MKKIILITAEVIVMTQMFVSLCFGANGTITGVIRAGKDPAPFAYVHVLGTTLGSQADENGKYAIANVPSGRYGVEARLVGLPGAIDSVTVHENRTTNHDFNLPPAQILERREEPWIPPGPPSKALLGRMDHADTVRVLRVSPKNSTPPLRLSDYDVSGRRVLPSKTARAFVHLMEQKESFDAGLMPGETKLCLPHPGVVVQFEDTDGMVNVFLCYECEKVWVVEFGILNAFGNFDRKGRDFVRWVKRALPDDPGIQALAEPKQD